ncbi:MAG: AraC family transcriptional regulator [Spirochaetales bacterium]|nr:AraC family transcriptional regulator [Spirochaetales bacterium]
MQKSAKPSIDYQLPKEILNPLNAVRAYSLSMPPPSAALADFVDHYWMLQWDRRGKAPYTCEVIPSPYINLTFSGTEAIVTGITTGKYRYEIKDTGMIFGIKFRPGAFHSFWRHSLSALTDRAVPAASLFSDITESVSDKVISTEPVERKIAYVETMLLDMHPVADPTIELVNDIIDAVERTERPTVRRIARMFHMSDRALQTLFHDRVGVGLKWVIMRVRLQRAAGIAVHRTSPDWADVAVDLGYANQSHFVNDFTRIIGMSPTRYAALVRTNNEK